VRLQAFPAPLVELDGASKRENSLLEAALMIKPR